MKRIKGAIQVLIITVTAVVLGLNYLHYLQKRAQRSAALVQAVQKENYILALELMDAGVDSTAFGGQAHHETTWQRLILRFTHIRLFYDTGPSALKLILDHLEAQDSNGSDSDEWERAARLLAARLVTAGADPNVASEQQGQTYLAFACSRNDRSMAAALLGHGANPNTPDSQGIHALSVCKDPQIVRLLLMHHANPNVVDEDSLTPLIDRVSTADLPSVVLLLEKGANVNYHDDNGETALSWATQRDIAPSIAGALLDRKADPNARNIYGETPLMGCDNPAIISLLVSHGAKIDAVDDGGRTALMTAVQYGLTDAARELTKDHARTDIKDDDGHTALWIAEQNESKGLATMMKAARSVTTYHKPTRSASP